jgi:predicted GNAT family acetyltransferase
MTQANFRRDTGRRRFEIEVDGSVAGLLNYRETGDGLDLVHTEVSPGYEGRGFGEQLVKYALDEAERDGHKVVPSCSFVAAYIQRHPRYQPLVAA